MDILGFLQSYGPSAGYVVVGFLFVLTIIVFIHELGHFLVARWCGVAVTTFSIGFGPELFGFNDRKGTRWKIAAIPLGGYVKFLGDENAASVTDQEAIAKLSPEDRKRAFISKPLWQRAAVVAAGPIANFILAIVIYTAVFSVFGRQDIAPRVDSVLPGSVAEAAGIKPGDLVVSINGGPVQTFAALQRVVTISAGDPIDLVIDRSGQQIPLRVVPQLQEQKDRFGNVHRVGVLGISRTASAGDVITTRFSVPEAMVEAGREVWFVIDRTLLYVSRVITGRESADQLGGPLRVAQVSGQVASLGFVPLISLAAFLSVSIGLINLVPIPMLDGGHLLYYALEKLRGRPLSDRAQDIGFRIGFALVIMLMIFAFYNDIIHLRIL